MTLEEFRRSAEGDGSAPAGLTGPLLALWWDARGAWDRAHEAAQAGADADSALVHAYLHRKEGDLANADYWYRRARRERPAESLEAEWVAMVGDLLGRGGG